MRPNHSSHSPSDILALPLQARAGLSAGSLSKVIYQSAKVASGKRPSSTIVNNFAADKMSDGDNLQSSASADGGNASDVARSRFAHRTTVQRRTPARSQASTQRSDRTQAREALSTSSNRGGGQSLSIKATTNTKRMNPHQTLTHYAGFDWAKNHHDIIVLDRQGQIVADFRMDHTPAGWRLWKEKIATWPQLGVAIETNFGATVEQLLESSVSLYSVNSMNAKRYRERQCSSGNKTDRHDAWALADALRKRITAFENAGQWESNAPLVAAKSLLAVARCRQLRVLQGQLDVYRQRSCALRRPSGLAMYGGHGTGELPVRAGPQSEYPSRLQQKPAPLDVSLCR